jgi:hypothetical protein
MSMIVYRYFPSVMSPPPIATVGHKNDGWYGDVLKEPL